MHVALRQVGLQVQAEQPLPGDCSCMVTQLPCMMLVPAMSPSMLT